MLTISSLNNPSIDKVSTDILIASILIDVKNMNRRSYKGVDDYGSVINVGDGYYNDAYEDEESKNTMK